MPKADEKQIAVARVYSHAMHDLGVAKGEADALAEELRELAAVVEDNAELGGFFASPLVDSGDRAASLERLFRGKASDLLVDSLQVINRKGRLGLVAAIAETYHVRHQEHLGRVDVQVATAVPLDAALRERLTSALARHSGRQPQLIERVDPALIGGMVLKIDDEKIDASVIHEIGRLRRALRERSEHEIYRSRQAAEAAG
jgi:F-type H+-transporting ATPase subunit delta